jgi:hypothetical protein
MDTAEQNQVALPVIGAAFQGGFFAGLFRIGDNIYANVVAPKAEGDLDDTVWNSKYDSVAGTPGFNDSLANTDAMAAAGSEIAAKVRALRIGGFDDWAIPAIDVLELCYRNLKPGTEENDCYSRAGINVSAAPPTYPYTQAAPAQTSTEAFKEGADEAFETAWYWTSTQHAAYDDSAWLQYFDDGCQDYYRKGNYSRVRAVRRVLISHSPI